MNYLVELNQDSQNNSILVRQTELNNQYASIRGWRVRQDIRTVSSLEEVADFILNNSDVIDHFFCLHQDSEKELLKLLKR